MDQTPISRILYAEDEAVVRLTVIARLKAAGFEVKGCESGDEAIDLLKSNVYDLILLDYRMPGMSGLNVLQWMHEQKIDTPAVILTAAGSEEVAVEAMKLGAYDYIRKDTIDFVHLPIVLRGIRERYLFRLEKAERERLSNVQLNHLAHFAAFHTSTMSLGHVLNNTLAVMSLKLNEGSEALSTELTEPSRERFRTMCAEIRQEFVLLSTGIASLMTLARSVQEGLRESKDPSEVERFVASTLAAVEREHRRLMNDDAERTPPSGDVPSPNS